MKHFKKFLLVLFGCSFTFLFAQNPEHVKKHQEYIAGINKTPNIQNDITNKLIQDYFVQQSEGITITDVSIMHGWDNPRVNCFLDVEVPQMAKLDVSEFHMPVNGRVTSQYGYRPKFRRMHRGIDLSLSTGDTVRAAFSGKIRIVSYEANGYGKYVVIRHDNGVETVYGHFSKHLVQRNQFVKAGEPIGLGGSTGRSTGPHLHFEIRYLGLALNPSTIVDFKEGTVLNDIYTFNKKTYQSYSQSHFKKNNKYRKKSYSTKTSKKKKSYSTTIKKKKRN